MQLPRRSLTMLLVFGGLSCAAQPWTAEQVRAMAAEAVLIDKDSVFTDGDWSALGPDLDGKELVLIGEPDHGTREVAELRNSLIEELQAKHGFDVVLFESGMGELILPDDASAEELANGLMGPWNTRSFVDLMAFIREHRMTYAGFDVQRSGRAFAQVLEEVCSGLKLDTALYAGLEERYGPTVKSFALKADPAAITTDASRLAIRYDALHSALERALPATPSARQLLTHRTLKNRADHIRYMLRFSVDKDWHARWAARDSAMAGNVRWLADTMYRGHKLIVIAHNYHIARSNPNERTMGEWLATHYGHRALVIGTFTGAGSYADNARQPKTLTAPDSTARDIKQVIAGLDGSANYLRLPTPSTPGTQWMHGPVVVNDTFIDLSNSNVLVPAQLFDALLLIRRASPPVFLDP